MLTVKLAEPKIGGQTIQLMPHPSASNLNIAMAAPPNTPPITLNLGPQQKATTFAPSIAIPVACFTDGATEAEPSLLYFCQVTRQQTSPGPIGTRITVATQQIPQPTKWYLTTEKFSDPAQPTEEFKSCIENSKKDNNRCFVLPSSQAGNVKGPVAGTMYVSWIWRTPDFPTEPGNYYIVALVGKEYLESINAFKFERTI